jgi:hypothetical protein
MIAVVAILALHVMAVDQDQLTPQQRAEVKRAEKLAKDPKQSAGYADMVNGKPPRTCDDQCEMMKKVLADGCKKKLGSKGASAVKKCEDRQQQTNDLCAASCRDKGKVDAEYIKTHFKKPKAPPGRDGPWKGGGGGGGDSDGASGGE